MNIIENLWKRNLVVHLNLRHVEMLKTFKIKNVAILKIYDSNKNSHFFPFFCTELPISG